MDLQRRSTRAVLLWAAIGLAAVPFGLLTVAVVADEGPVPGLDRWVADHVHDLVRDQAAVVDVTKAVTTLGEGVVFVPLVLAASVLFFWRRRPTLVLYVVLASVGAGLIDRWAKLAVGRERPLFDDPIALGTGKAFPSGHAMSSTAIYGALLLALLPLVPARWRRTAVLAVAGLVLAIGASRIVLGVHWLSDVVAGHVLGLAWLAFVTALFEIWRVERGLAPTAPVDEGVEPEVRDGTAPEARRSG